MNIRKEIISIITNGEESNLSKGTMTLLELILKEKTLYDLKKMYCKEAFNHMKEKLNFVTFYFRYNMNNSYDTVINLENCNQTKTRREITLIYDKDVFKILKEEVMTKKEKEIIYKDIDFYKELTLFGIENYYPRKELKTTSRNFTVSLFNDQLVLSSNNGNFNISYLYDTEDLGQESNAVEVYSNNLLIKRLLEKNEYRNLIRVLENIKIYKEELPKNIDELKRKTKVLKK